MATVQRSRLREMLARADGYYFSGSLTETGGASGATITDTKIARENRNQMPDRWVLLTSGGISGEARRISTVSDDAAGVITPVRNFSAQVADAVSYVVLPWDPLDGHAAIEEAIRLLNQYTPLSLAPNETLVVDNLIANWDFETYAGSDFASWTRQNVGASQTTTRLVHGSNGAQIAPVAAGGGIEQNLLSVANGPRRIDQAVGKTLHVRAWIFATTADVVRLRVTFDGTTYTNGPFHGGDDEWEGPSIHQIGVAIPANPSEATVSIEANVISTFWVDVAVAWIDSIHRYTVPTSFAFPAPTKVSQQDNEGRPNGDYRPISLRHPPIPGRILRLEGTGRLTVPSTDTGTVELDEPAAELLVALAGRVLHRTLKNVGFGASERHLSSELDWKQEVKDLVAARGLNKPQQFITVNHHLPWEVKDEGGTSYLYLKDR